MPRTVDPELHERRRGQILGAAAVCFMRRGFHKTTMHEICSQAGMSPGGIYQYFANKDAIIVAIVEKQREESALVIAALEGTQDFVERLVDIMQVILHAFRDPTYGRLGVEVFAEGSRNSHVREVLRRDESELKEAFSTALKKVQAAGQFDPGLSSEQLAEVLLALIAGLSSRAIVDPDYKPDQLSKVIETCTVRFISPISLYLDFVIRHNKDGSLTLGLLVSLSSIFSGALTPS